MLCTSCQTENELAAQCCSACGAALIAEDEILTRFTSKPRYNSPDHQENFEATIVHGWSSTAGPPQFDAQALVCLMPGTVLGRRYEIQTCLGEGGMGAVYKARDREVDRLVAIKVIRPELANDPAILQRFKQEIVLARQVTHRNIVRVYDLGAADGLRFISMEYIEGHELNEVLAQRGKFEPKEAAGVILQVAQGLEAAHSQNVVHRDLKPQNIMLDGQGRAAVMDFGIAYSVGLPSDVTVGAAPATATGNGLTQFGSFLGTPRYMSPEQGRCESADARSDLYSLGIIFYELLTGRVPFSGASVKEALLKRLNDPLVPPIKIDPAIPKQLNNIVLKCLQTDPEKRYQSASELITELEVWLGLRTAAGTRRTMWRITALVAAAITLVASVLVIREWTARGPKPHPTVKLLISDFHNATGDPLFAGTVEPMLQVALESASFVTSFNRGEAHRLAAKLKPGLSTLDGNTGRLVAMREGVGVVVSGSIERHGNGYRLSANAIKADSGSILSAQNANFREKNELPLAVGQVAGRIRRALGDSVPASQGAAAETFTSASLASAQKYAEAQQFQWDGKWEQAIHSYQEATKLDPNMSRAYAGLAATLANLGRRQEAEHYYQLALAHIDRESEREKFRTRGGYYLLERDYGKATEQFHQLVKLYPSDSAGLANLALAYFYERNMSAALEEGRKAVGIYPNNLLQRNNLGLYAMYAGDFDAAIKESQAIIAINPAFEKAYLCLGLSQLGRGSVADASSSYQKMATLSVWGSSEASLALGDLAMYQGNLKDAIQQLEKGIKADWEHSNPSAAAVKLIALADAQMERGQHALALTNAAKAVAVDSDESIVYGAARIDLRAGDKKNALLLSKKLSSRFGPEPQALSKLIDGEAQLEGGKIHEALASFQDAQKAADTWLGRYDLGRTYLAAKLYPDADNEFDVCLKRRGEAAAVFLDDEPTMHLLPTVYYYQGIARQGLHSPGADESFKEFLAMKQTSESDPMVSDAKRRLKLP